MRYRYHCWGPTPKAIQKEEDRIGGVDQPPQDLPEIQSWSSMLLVPASFLIMSIPLSSLLRLNSYYRLNERGPLMSDVSALIQG